MIIMTKLTVTIDNLINDVKIFIIFFTLHIFIIAFFLSHRRFIRLSLSIINHLYYFLFINQNIIIFNLTKSRYIAKIRKLIING